MFERSLTTEKKETYLHLSSGKIERTHWRITGLSTSLRLEQVLLKYFSGHKKEKKE